MKRRIALGALAGVALLIVLAVVFARIADAPSDASETPSSNVTPTAATIARGAYLAAAGDCISCHSVPGKPDYAGGTPFKLPFGTIYGSNITPDVTFGIGSWSDADFITAMHRGIAKDGHHLYPAFPYANYTRMPVADVLAIKAYLFTQKPAALPSPQNAVVFPFNQTWGIAYWNLLFNANRRFEEDPSRSTLVNRGAYLVEGPGHCELCHTPMTFAYSTDASKAMAGAVIDGARAYNISSDTKWGIGSWTTTELVAYLSAGYAQGRGAAGPSMGQVVQNDTSHLTGDDLLAIATYLKQVPPRNGTVEIAAATQPVAPAGTLVEESDGRAIYVAQCMSCHGTGGTAPAFAGTLAGHPSVNDTSGTNSTLAVLHGVDVTTTTDRIYMPAFGHAYSDAEIAAVVRYVNAAFGRESPSVTGQSVAKARPNE
jgi:mono/diheme cytochrome c family protein